MSASCTDCTPAPCPEGSSIICDPRYFNMLVAGRLRLLGVPPGSKCQLYLESKRGFVFDDGSGLGQFISEQPALTLPIINSVASNVYDTPPGFPFMLVGTGTAPHPWGFVRGKTGVASQLQWDGNSFQLVTIGSQPALTTVCSGGGFSGSVGLIGCLKTGLDGEGNPVYAMRKLTALNNHPVVGVVDGDGVSTFKCLADADTLTHTLGKFTDTLRFNQFRAINDDGTEITNGLPLLVTYGAGAVTDAVKCYYSPAEKKLYLAPAGYVNSKSVGATVLAVNTPVNAFTWDSVVLNYKALLVTFQFCFGLDVATVDVMLDGVVKQSWINQNLAVDPADAAMSSISGTVVLSGIVPGVHTVIVRIKTKGGADVIQGAASVVTMDCP